MSNQLSVIDGVRSALTRMKEQFQMALPAHIKPERFLRVAMTAIQNSPSLLECDRTSLFASCTRAAQDGLLPDGKEAALVPFKNTVQYMPMYQGILKKFRNSGECKSVMAGIVYKNDKFKYYVDSTGEHIEHEPMMFGDRGEKIGFYAMATTKDGGIYIEVMTMQDMDKVRQVSRASSGPWKSWPEEMEKKSVIRRLAKRLPMSTDLEEFVSQNDNMINFDQDKQEETTTPSRTKSLIQDSIDVPSVNTDDEVPI